MILWARVFGNLHIYRAIKTISPNKSERKHTVTYRKIAEIQLKEAEKTQVYDVSGEQQVSWVKALRY